MYSSLLLPPASSFLLPPPPSLEQGQLALRALGRSFLDLPVDTMKDEEVKARVEEMVKRMRCEVGQ